MPLGRRPVSSCRPPNKAPPFDLAAFALSVVFDRVASQAHQIQAKDPTSATWEPLGLSSPGVASASLDLSRRYLDRLGAVRLRWSNPLTDDAWFFMLPKPSSGPPISGDLDAVKPQAIAYVHMPVLQSVSRSWGSVLLDPNAHVLAPSFDESGAIQSLTVDGEDWNAVSGVISTSDSLAFQSMSSSNGVTTVNYLHRNANPLRVTIAQKKDRLRYSFRYEVATPIAEGFCTCARFELPDPFSQLETLNPTDTTGLSYVVDASKPLVMAQFPFVAARAGSGRYLGVLDYNLSGLVAQLDQAGNDLSVEEWIWPSKANQVLTWSFEVLAGWEGYPGAMIRAVNTYTKSNTSKLQGGGWRGGTSWTA
jgi:hypothetical protein